MNILVYSQSKTSVINKITLENIKISVAVWFQRHPIIRRLFCKACGYQNIVWKSDIIISSINQT